MNDHDPFPTLDAATLVTATGGTRPAEQPGPGQPGGPGGPTIFDPPPPPGLEPPLA